MSILGKAVYENEEEKFTNAQANLDAVLALLPDYVDFRTEDVIRDRIEDPELKKKLENCHIQITNILKKLGYVVTPVGKSVRLELTELGRKAKAAGGHQSYHFNKHSMVPTETVLRYFYKQNRRLALHDLFDKFGIHDSILKPVHELVDNDWLVQIKPQEWEITTEGRQEYERIERAKNPPPAQTTTNTIYVSGQVAGSINAGNLSGDHFSLSKSLSPEASKSDPANKRKIDWNTLLKIISGIVIIAAGLLKYYGII